MTHTMKEGTLYRHILRDAWQLTWKNKLLWIFGFLAVFWGDVGAYQTLNGALGDLNFSFPQTLSGAIPRLPPFASVTTAGAAVGIIVMILFSAVLLSLLILAIAARGGLLHEIASRKRGKKISVKGGLRQGFKAFWPLLGVGILTKLDIVLAFFLVHPLIVGPTSSSTLALFILLFTITTLISLILSFLGIYASALIMLQGYSLGKAIKESFALFSSHWLVSIEMALLLYGIGFLVGLAVLLVLAVLAIPFLLLATIVTFLHLQGAVWFVLLLAAAVYIALLVLLGSAFVTFQYTAWTLLFLRLEEQPVAKIVRLTSRFGHILHKKIV